jgi:hypothetical protein
MIKKYDLDAFVISGPGHGAPGLISNFYLEGVWSETYGNTPENKEGLQRFFKQFSFPGGHGSHMTPEVSSQTILQLSCDGTTQSGMLDFRMLKGNYCMIYVLTFIIIGRWKHPRGW